MYDKTKIEKMRKAADILSRILKKVASEAKEGVSLAELDAMAEQMCKENNVIPAFKGYEGFPSTLCTGLNDVVVHGIPDESVLKDGDIVSIDMGIKYQDVYSDCAVTVAVGEVSKDAKRLMDSTKRSVEKAVSMAKVGNTLGDIGHAIQSTVEADGFSVVKEMVGHGIGYELHEDPFVPGFGTPGQGQKLQKGMVLAIEAIINQGSPDIGISREDGWTSVTKDGMLSALFEHTVVVDENPDVLTKW